MLKITLSLLTLVAIASASDYSRANSAAADALRGLDCEFEDCTPKVSKPIEPKVIVKEKIIYRDRPVEVEKVIVKEKIVYRDKPVVVTNTNQVKTQNNGRVYNSSFDVPVIGVTGSSFYNKVEYFHIEDDKVKPRKQAYNSYLKTQSRAAWATMKLKNGKSLFLNNYDDTIPYYRESMMQINFHVELPKKVIAHDSVVIALPKKVFKNNSGQAEEYSSCSFNNFIPNDSSLQKEINLSGKNYLDIKCTVVLYNYNTQSNVNNEIQSMVQTESFDFIPVYRVFPPVRKGSKKAILGSKLKKFVFLSEIAD